MTKKNQIIVKIQKMLNAIESDLEIKKFNEKYFIAGPRDYNLDIEKYSEKIKDDAISMFCDMITSTKCQRKYGKPGKLYIPTMFTGSGAIKGESYFNNIHYYNYPSLPFKHGDSEQIKHISIITKNPLFYKKEGDHFISLYNYIANL